MASDVSSFYKLVVADTCAVWNVLSARILHHAGISAGCHFSLTEFGLYECLHKPRKSKRPAEVELQDRLRSARKMGQFESYSLEVEDLQEVDVLAQRRNLSKGEIAAIAFAKKTRQAFLTDDQGARKLAATAIDGKLVQTTPHLLGWLVFTGLVGDSDVPTIIAEHQAMERPLKQYFKDMYAEALRCRLIAMTNSKAEDDKER